MTEPSCRRSMMASSLRGGKARHMRPRAGRVARKNSARVSLDRTTEINEIHHE